MKTEFRNATKICHGMIWHGLTGITNHYKTLKTWLQYHLLFLFLTIIGERWRKWGKVCGHFKNQKDELTKYLKYLVGLAIIIIGLLIKATLNHNMNYWSFVRGFSILSFAVGLVLMIPRSLEKTNDKGKKSSSPRISKIVAKLKPIILTILLFVVILGLERLGGNLNYRLRDYFLNHDTAIATGYAKGIKRIDLVKIGHEDFYLIDFNVGDKVQSSGLMVAYAAKDSGLFTEMNQYKNSEGQLIINNLRSGNVQVKYSKKFPSFFKVNE